jgi:hypothetical protein
MIRAAIAGAAAGVGFFCAGVAFVTWLACLLVGRRPPPDRYAPFGPGSVYTVTPNGGRVYR